uniref:Uncharacterized protein n=1 Tax=mine drainage metagenome TaxID=410659 RepID=E6QAJ6_9ZZZZ
MADIGIHATAQYRHKKRRPKRVALLALAGRTGLEPATSGVTGRHSNQLNYHPNKIGGGR